VLDDVRKYFPALPLLLLHVGSQRQWQGHHHVDSLDSGPPQDKWGGELEESLLAGVPVLHVASFASAGAGAGAGTAARQQGYSHRMKRALLTARTMVVTEYTLVLSQYSRSRFLSDLHELVQVNSLVLQVKPSILLSVFPCYIPPIPCHPIPPSSRDSPQALECMPLGGCCWALGATCLTTASLAWWATPVLRLDLSGASMASGGGSPSTVLK
jgi:hypothetical protein